jgi:hypothetical protein
VAGGAEEAVDEPAHEGRVEAVFRLQARQPSVCYSLRTWGRSIRTKHVLRSAVFCRFPP